MYSLQIRTFDFLEITRILAMLFCVVSLKILNTFFLFNVLFTSTEVGGEMSVCRKPRTYSVSSDGIISSLSSLFFFFLDLYECFYLFIIHLYPQSS